MEQHLKDYVWMKKGDYKPEKVNADPELISQKMVAGYSQVFPANEPKEDN